MFYQIQTSLMQSNNNVEVKNNIIYIKVQITAVLVFTMVLTLAQPFDYLL